jgi:orotidine-5'-phosphate decarboxylase
MQMTVDEPRVKKSKSVPNNSLLSQKEIPARERLIFALDVSSTEEAKALVEQLDDSVVFYKLGLQIFLAPGFYELIEWLRDGGKKIMVDLKIFDVPETVKSAISQLKNKGVSFATVHGNDAIMRAAVGEKNGVKILAVTVLTSLDQADLRDLGFQCDAKTLVLSRAKRALEIGCDGVISSGLEAPELRTHYGNNFLIVSPGIRPLENRPHDDQKRVATVEEAFLGGADYIVVGRPIRDAADPRAQAQEIQNRIQAIFEKG